MKLVFALLSIITLATLVQAQIPRDVKISASNILSDVAKRKKTQPGITAKELAAYANKLLAKRGFDYDFDAGDTVLSPNPEDSLCGENSVRVAARLVNKREIHLIANGKTYRARRPAAFLLEEVELVDANLKVLRRWEMPYQTVPAGISLDGTKLYLDFYTEYSLDDLILELSEDGRLAFQDRAELGLKEGTLIEDFPKDPNNAYLSFIKFEAGNKTYTVRFNAPCT